MLPERRTTERNARCIDGVRRCLALREKAAAAVLLARSDLRAKLALFCRPASDPVRHLQDIRRMPTMGYIPLQVAHKQSAAAEDGTKLKPASVNSFTTGSWPLRAAHHNGDFPEPSRGAGPGVRS